MDIQPEDWNNNTWILLKIGCVVIPIHSFSNIFCRMCWILGSRVPLEDGYKLVFGIERKWVIDILVFDKKFDLVHPDWFGSEDELKFPVGADGWYPPCVCFWFFSVIYVLLICISLFPIF